MKKLINSVQKPKAKYSCQVDQITFIYDIANDTCFIQKNNQLQELTIKGSCEYQGLVNGTWFQIDEKENHWIWMNN